MNLNHLIRETNTKLFFRVECVAELNAVRGFMGVLGIRRQHAVVSYGLEAPEKLTKAMFKGCLLTKSRTLSPNWFSVKFDTEGKTRLAERGLIVNYDPYKYYHPTRVSSKERVRLRRAMRIKKDRKVIVVSCSTRDEVEVVLKAYKRLGSLDNPLLIVGLRRLDLSLPGFLSRRGFRTHDRRSLKQALSCCGGSDIVVLNTMGELFNFLKVADLAIVGHDRNIFEPALLDVPILYFSRPLSMNERERELARWFNLFWRKNRTAKKMLDKFGGAARIRRPAFHRQIDHALRYPGPMIRGARRAVRVFRDQIIPASGSGAASALTEGIAKRRICY